MILAYHSILKKTREMKHEQEYEKLKLYLLPVEWHTKAGSNEEREPHEYITKPWVNVRNERKKH